MRLERGDQFWEIELDDRMYVVRGGRTGTRGEAESVTRAFATIELARRAHDDAIVERLKDGYRRVGASLDAVPAIANAELEAAIRDQPDDPAPYLVYADWLQGAGSVVGELIVLMHQLDEVEDVRTRKRLDALLGRLDLPLPDRASFGWRWGLWSWLRIHDAFDDRETRASSGFDAIATARALFASPLCGVLEELRIGALRWDENRKLVAGVLDEALRYRWGRELRRLHVGDVDDPDYRADGLVGLISKELRGLVALRIRSTEYGVRTSDVLELPRLERLAIESTSLGRYQLADALAARVPRLEELELWFGVPLVGERPIDGDDLAPLLGGDVLRGVRRLGLRNAPNTDDLIDRLVGSPAIAGRLEALDLSLGTLGDDAAVVLAERARELPRLIRLDVDDNYLTAEGLRVLATAFPHACVTSHTQKLEATPQQVSVPPSWMGARYVQRARTSRSERRDDADQGGGDEDGGDQPAARVGDR